ncbi:hypothetical protein LIER_02313 [Lithospermum erythrorhizon]|uniref:Uncharacterized protein n=1 Tax=Lithospermum erythrorhizon TaxID=34254 RepID=A0AAV3NNY0_LITER
MTEENKHVKFNRADATTPEETKKQSNVNLSRFYQEQESKAAPQTPTSSHQCLCSPTTHAGSFRCRLHRVRNIGGLRRIGASCSSLTTLASNSL